MAAVSLVPEARFGINPVGHFGWHLVSFALLVGTPLAVVQCLFVWRVFSPLSPARLFLVLLWIPFTSLSILAMLLPMWWWTADIFASMPLSSIMPPLPGAAILGLSQALLIFGIAGTQGYWVLATILGAAVGVVVGLMTALMLPLGIEVVWALFTGVCIGYFQGFALSDVLARRDRTAQ
jgi:hypothetical protein